MENRKFWLGMLVMVLAFGMTVVGCDNGSTGGGNDGSLDGTWNQGPMTIVISGDGYTSILEGKNFGKGTISYDGSTVTLNSTHAWSNSSWTPFSETITGSYSLSGNTLTISGIQGTYSSMNGNWSK